MTLAIMQSLFTSSQLEEIARIISLYVTKGSDSFFLSGEEISGVKVKHGTVTIDMSDLRQYKMPQADFVSFKEEIERQGKVSKIARKQACRTSLKTWIECKGLRNLHAWRRQEDYSNSEMREALFFILNHGGKDVKSELVLQALQTVS